MALKIDTVESRARASASSNVARWFISVGRKILGMSRAHPKYFDPQSADRLVVGNSLVGGDPEEDEPEDEDEEGEEDGDEEDEGYSE